MPARATSRTKSEVQPPARAIAPSKSTSSTPARAEMDELLLLTIKTLGSLLDDLEAVRVMNGNRIGALERTFGSGLPELTVAQETLASLEHQTELQLVRAWRQHPLAEWARDYHGLGEKSIGRLVATIGDPGERPNVAKLWSYCGHGEPTRKHWKGMSQEEAFRCGNPRAKKQVWLISTSMLKAGNRDYYDAARAKYAGRDWTDGHRHAAALRYQGKQFLVDLWVAARRHHHSDAHSEFAGAVA